LPAGFIAPYLPTKTDKLPSGSQWLHEIKHDGFRVIARKNGAQVRLYSRPGNDLTHRFPLIVDALSRLRSRSCIIDGEAVACDDNGVASFNLIRYRRHDDSTFLYAFDLIELNDDDLRRDPLEVRKATLASIVAKASPGLRLNEHMEGDGPTVFAHACKMGLEGITRAPTMLLSNRWRGRRDRLWRRRVRLDPLLTGELRRSLDDVAMPLLSLNLGGGLSVDSVCHLRNRPTLAFHRTFDELFSNAPQFADALRIVLVNRLCE